MSMCRGREVQGERGGDTLVIFAIGVVRFDVVLIPVIFFEQKLVVVPELVQVHLHVCHLLCVCVCVLCVCVCVYARARACVCACLCVAPHTRTHTPFHTRAHTQQSIPKEPTSLPSPHPLPPARLPRTHARGCTQAHTHACARAHTHSFIFDKTTPAHCSVLIVTRSGNEAVPSS